MENIPLNIPVLHNIVMDLNNIMLWSMYHMGFFLEIFHLMNEGWYGDWKIRVIEGPVGLC